MILDTNALSAWADGDHGVLRVMVPSIEIPVIVVGEYLFGLGRSRRGEALRSWLASAIAAATVLPVTLATAETYAHVRGHLKASGRPVAANDVWIAALALQHDLPILSRDMDFDYVAGVERISW